MVVGRIMGETWALPSERTRVPQRTIVVKLTRAEGKSLLGRLEGGGFEFRSVPHAAFSAKGEGVVATLYNSGKLVVQGGDPDAFLARYGQAPAASPAERKTAGAPSESLPTRPIIGSDESGKGDYFGPLVVAALRLEPEQAEELTGSGVADSKKLTDATCLRLGAALRGRYPCSVQRMDPPEYNRERERFGNLNPLLAELHARAIRALARPGIDVLVDQFGDRKLVERALGDLDVRLSQRPRAEENIAVAAASVIAREEFLRALAELSDEHAIDLCKGAGAPADAAGRRFLALHGRERLGAVAKLHFKNTRKIGA